MASILTPMRYGQLRLRFSRDLQVLHLHDIAISPIRAESAAGELHMEPGLLFRISLELGLSGTKRPHKHKDPTLWFHGPMQGGNQNSWFVGSLRVCGLLGP